MSSLERSRRVKPVRIFVVRISKLTKLALRDGFGDG